MMARSSLVWWWAACTLLGSAFVDAFRCPAAGDMEVDWRASAVPQLMFINTALDLISRKHGASGDLCRARRGFLRSAQQESGEGSVPQLTVGQVRDVFNQLSVVVIEAERNPETQKFEGVGASIVEGLQARLGEGGRMSKIKVKDLPRALTMLNVEAKDDSLYQEMRAIAGDEGMMGLADFVRFVQEVVQALKQ